MALPGERACRPISLSPCQPATRTWHTRGHGLGVVTAKVWKEVAATPILPCQVAGRQLFSLCWEESEVYSRQDLWEPPPSTMADPSPPTVLGGNGFALVIKIAAGLARTISLCTMVVCLVGGLFGSLSSSETRDVNPQQWLHWRKKEETVGKKEENGGEKKSLSASSLFRAILCCLLTSQT